MKKILIPLLLSYMIFFLVGCTADVQPISLPTVEEIDKISIEMINGTKVSYEDIEYIEQVVSILLDAKATNKKSVQDVPVNKDFGSIHLENESKTTTVFYYEENKKYYIEQAYQGIYETDVDLESLFEGIE